LLLSVLLGLLLLGQDDLHRLPSEGRLGRIPLLLLGGLRLDAAVVTRSAAREGSRSLDVQAIEAVGEGAAVEGIGRGGGLVRCGCCCCCCCG